MSNKFKGIHSLGGYTTSTGVRGLFVSLDLLDYEFVLIPSLPLQKLQDLRDPYWGHADPRTRRANANSSDIVSL